MCHFIALMQYLSKLGDEKDIRTPLREAIGTLLFILSVDVLFR